MISWTLSAGESDVVKRALDRWREDLMTLPDEHEAHALEPLLQRLALDVAALARKDRGEPAEASA